MLLKKNISFFLSILFVLSFVSCSKRNIGWGVLLWVIDDPAIPSGTVLPVQIRSNIEQAWITGVPDTFKTEVNQLAMVPLPHLEFFRTKSAADKFAAEFAERAIEYAETMQDGLPIRDRPENNARRVYRLRAGEIIKILEKVEGIEAISAAGDPLEGNWFRVLTHSGSIGYCFSNRLRIFDHGVGLLGEAPVQGDIGEDRELEVVLNQIWYPEFYRTMIDSGRLDLDILSRNYCFTAGIANRRARIFLENGEQEFSYMNITRTGDRSWNFDETSLTITLRSESMLDAQWEDENRMMHTATFVTLPASMENIVNQERERQQNKFQVLYDRGPRFSSANYGSLIINAQSGFSWDEINELPEGMISDTAVGNGTLDMDYHLSGEMADRYTGALAMHFNTTSGNRNTLIFAYILDNQGLRMEHIPSNLASSRTVSRRSPSPFMIYFSAEH